jgi:hypothetical protein
MSQTSTTEPGRLRAAQSSHAVPGSPVRPALPGSIGPCSFREALRGIPRLVRARPGSVFGAGIATLLFAPACLAGPSQDEVFKSIQSSVNSHNDNGAFLAVLAVIAGVVLIVAVVQSRSRRPPGTSAALNNAAKLTRELMKSTGLKPGQLRQLRSLADDLDDRGTPIANPLTLLLCPSLLRQAKGEAASPKSETRDPNG